jgi:tetratricopeptide (TPR) repeat protein
MKIRWSFLLLVCSLQAVTAAQELSDPRYDREMARGIDLILRQEYDSASGLFASMVQKDKDYPAGYFMRMTLIAARFYDKNDTSSMNDFYQSIDRILTLSKDRQEPIYDFYQGTALAFLSVFQAKDGRWMAGAIHGKMAADIFKRMIKNGVVSGDVLGMLGSYHYWVSAVMKNFIWLPFIQDRREQGISEMTLALKTSKYLRFGLLNSLLWVYYDNGRFREALALCEQALKNYPDHRIFSLIRMHILYKLKDYEAALTGAQVLLKAYDKYEEVPVNYNSIKIKMALIYYSMGKKKAADAIAEEMTRNSYEDYLNQRLKKDFEILAKSRY